MSYSDIPWFCWGSASEYWGIRDLLQKLGRTQLWGVTVSMGELDNLRISKHSSWSTGLGGQSEKPTPYMSTPLININKQINAWDQRFSVACPIKRWRWLSTSWIRAGSWLDLTIRMCLYNVQVVNLSSRGLSASPCLFTLAMCPLYEHASPLSPAEWKVSPI